MESKSAGKRRVTAGDYTTVVGGVKFVSLPFGVYHAPAQAVLTIPLGTDCEMFEDMLVESKDAADFEAKVGTDMGGLGGFTISKEKLMAAFKYLFSSAKVVYYAMGYENEENIVLLKDVKPTKVGKLDDARTFEYGVEIIRLSGIPQDHVLIFNLDH